MDPSVSVERIGGVAVITIDNAPLKNALTAAMAHDWQAICADIDADQEIGAAVIRGAAGTFCSGADTSVWSDVYSDPAGDRSRAESDAYYGSFYRLGHLQVPTIAAVRGAAVGAGLNLALATDLRVVSDEARLLGGFVHAGIHPGGGFFTLVSRVAGREAAAALGIFSQEMSGQRAAEVGLAWCSVPDDEVDALALQMAGDIAADPLFARRLVHSYRLETGAGAMPWAVALELERGVQIWSLARRRDAMNGSRADRPDVSTPTSRT